MQWRDAADVVLKANPNATPMRGACFVSADGRWSVARVDTRDESKGWRVWMGQRAIGDHLFFAGDAEAKVFAGIVSMPIRGLARVLGVLSRGRRLALDVAKGLARLQELRRVFVDVVTEPPPEPGRPAESFKNGERALAGGGRLLERVEGYEFQDAPGAVAFRCLATVSQIGRKPAAMIAVPRGTRLQPTDIRLMRTAGLGLHIAGSKLTVREVVRKARQWSPDRGPGTFTEALAIVWAITEADVSAALAYAEAHPAEFVDVDAGLAQEAAP